jgi:hypothetical protein
VAQLPSAYLHHTSSARKRYRVERPAEDEKSLPVEARFQLAVNRWGEQFGGYVDFHDALAAARDALDEGDPEVSVLLCRLAAKFLEGTAGYTREREGRLKRRLVRRIRG